MGCFVGTQIYLEAAVLSVPDLYGGKICAALDRQHPRDLFDVKILLEAEGITQLIRKAFLVYLISHDRPVYELLQPNPKDFRSIFDSEFQGMTFNPVSMDDLINTRSTLIETLHKAMTDDEKRFLLSLKKGNPNWLWLGLEGIKKLPAVQWKIHNIQKMGAEKHEIALDKLKRVLNLDS